MKIAIVAPSAVPFVVGGAEKLWWGLYQEINENTAHEAEVIKLPSPERSFWEVIDSYEQYWNLDLSHFDLVISGKYPGWMVRHPNHVCYMLHRLRGFYDCYHLFGLPESYKTDIGSLVELKLLLRSNPEPNIVQNVFDLLRDLRCKKDLPQDAFQFPGALLREVVHFFDNTALQPRLIRRYAAISRNVAGREDYFPSGVAPEIIYPPSSLKNLRCEAFSYILVVSRLDAPKRIDLIIEAMKLVKAWIELRICGEGSEEGRLRQLAAADRRIRFMKHRSDSDLVDDYANALAIVFTPFDEDYGLITVEAMMSGKPVITTTDAGGPNEFVVDGQTGFSVAPEPQAIAERIEWVAQHRDQASAMGACARARVESITWAKATERLLGAHRLHSGISQPPPCRLTVATTFFGVTPIRGGGQARVFNLYKNLAPMFETELIVLGNYGSEPFSRVIAPGLIETCIPKSREHEEAEKELSREVEWFPITDVAFSDLVRFTPEYGKTLEHSCRSAHAVVACHPYTFAAIESATDKPIWYEAQDVEYLLKREVMPKTPRGLQLITEVEALERRCCERATIVMACSEDDGNQLQSLYGLSTAKLRVVPNGVDTTRIRFTSRQQCLLAKTALGLADCFCAIFIGSWHEPNLRAIQTILSIAEKCPSVRFLILGSSCLAFAQRSLPDNVGLLGVVDDLTKEIVLQTADVALNPVEHGSGTNLKMLEYAAAGVPILTTEAGIRGLGFRNHREVLVTQITDFPKRLESLQSASGITLDRLTKRARKRVSDDFEWRTIARRFTASLGEPWIP